MKFIIKALVFVILTLITIGDAVIIFFAVIRRLSKQLGAKISKTTTSFFQALRFIFSHISRMLGLGIRMLATKIRNAYLEFRIKKKKEAKKLKKLKLRQQTYSPLLIRSKLRYFTGGVLFSFLFLFIPLLVMVFLQDLPSPQGIWLGQIPQTTKIYDRNGTLLYQIYANQNRTLVPLAKIPKNLQDATIAIEDKDFYKHPGFDVSAIIRSFIENAKGGSLQGGSTITQQLIKSALLTPETRISRKVKEVILAIWTERIYSKNQILEMYFNQIAFGGTAWGAQAASEVYFGKNVEDLTLAESAFLAGIPRAPSIYSPYGQNPTLWKKRQKEVLDKMQFLGYISEKEKQEALSEELVFQTPQTPLYAPHFVMYVKDHLIQKYGLSTVEKGGLMVKTSIDLPFQNQVQQIVKEEVDKNAHLNLSNGAAVVSNPKNGDVLAMVGSKDFRAEGYGKVNIATSLRQPGSSIKLVTYAAALEKGLTAASILDDSPVTYSLAGAQSYSPVNYDGRFHGRVPLRVAFANSFNIPAVKTLNMIGVDSMVSLGKKMGIGHWNDPSNYGLSITLGAAEATMLDMATIYATVANSGKRVDIDPILEITDYKGTVLQKKPSEIQGLRVLDEGIAFILSDILADNNARSGAFGLNSALVVPNHRVSVKTGTSDDKRDNWTIGYTPSHVVTVWVGNNDNAPMSREFASGITGAAPIWNTIMQLLLKNMVDSKVVIPANITQRLCNGRIEYFIKGTENNACSSRPMPTRKLPADL